MSSEFIMRNMNTKIIEMLDQSKKNVEGIINSIPNVIAVILDDGRIFDGNMQLAKILSLDKEDLINVNIRELFDTSAWDTFHGKIAYLKKNVDSESSIEMSNVRCEVTIPIDIFNATYESNSIFLWQMYPLNTFSVDDSFPFLIVGTDITEIELSRIKFKDLSKNLEKKVNERTITLRKKSKVMSELLENMKQGLFSVLPNGKIHNEYSRHLEKIFCSGEIVDTDAIDFLFSDSDIDVDKIDRAKKSLMCSFDSIVSFDLNREHFVREVTKSVNGKPRKLEIDWSPILSEDNNVERILINVKDVTEFRKLQEQLHENSVEAKIINEILSASLDKFNAFMTIANDLVSESIRMILADKVYNHNYLKRIYGNLHTIKGNSRMFEFSLISNTVHMHENYYSEIIESQEKRWDQARMHEGMKKIENILERYQMVCDRLLNNIFGRGRYKDESQIFHICYNRYKKDPSLFDDELKNLFAKYESIALNDLIDDVFENLKRTSFELNKMEPNIELECDRSYRFSKYFAGKFESFFVHCLNNCIDHGIEETDERIKKGKSIQGKIAIKISRISKFLQILISDDGKGINIKNIYDLAISKKVIDETHKMNKNTAVKILLSPGFTSKKDTNLISGRGMGMDAMKVQLEEIGGDMNIIFDKNIGNEVYSFYICFLIPEKFITEESVS